jgi:hypothetical protein
VGDKKQFVQSLEAFWLNNLFIPLRNFQIPVNHMLWLCYKECIIFCTWCWCFSINVSYSRFYCLMSVFCVLLWHDCLSITNYDKWQVAHPKP